MNIGAIIEGIKAGLRNLLKGKESVPPEVSIERKKEAPMKKKPVAKAKPKKETKKKKPAKTVSKTKTINN